MGWDWGEQQIRGLAEVGRRGRQRQKTDCILRVADVEKPISNRDVIWDDRHLLRKLPGSFAEGEFARVDGS